MIEKISWDRDFGSTFRVECDRCGEDEEINGDFDDCIDFIKDNEWKTTKEDGEWINICPECQKKQEDLQ